MVFASPTENPHFNDVLDVEPEDVFEHKSEVLLVDVRSEQEFKGELGHIPGATLLTLDQLPEKATTLPKNKTIVFVCRSGGRSAQATALLLDNGYTDVFNMRGGMLLWNECGFEIEK